jgi:hypothetical protein
VTLWAYKKKTTIYKFYRRYESILVMKMLPQNNWIVIKTNWSKQACRTDEGLVAVWLERILISDHNPVVAVFRPHAGGVVSIQQNRKTFF